jgi:uncharacterized protein DUF2865
LVSTVRAQRFTTASGQRARAAVVHGLAALATVALAGTCAAHYGGTFAAPSGGASIKSAQIREGGRRPLRLAQSGQGSFFSFLEGLFGGEERREPRRPRRIEQPRRAPPPAPQEAPPQAVVPPAGPPETMGPPVPATFRTMCVRLCDGYYWPVSYATTQEYFARDEQACLNSCGASAALYSYPNPGGQPDDMVNLQGQPYKSLATAFVYRTVYDPNCKCRAHPWEAAAIARHKAYAAAESKLRAVAQGTRPRR